MMAKLCDERGQEAVVGKSIGYWLCDDDFVSTEGLSAKELGIVGFPRNWPTVYTTSKPLKSLIGKKGQCPGKKVGVVGAPSKQESELVEGVSFYPLQSFSNAERVEKVSGMAVVYGWSVLEHLDRDISAAFVAERYWWNILPDGTWVDFTPRPDEWPELLLAEAASDASKGRKKLTEAESELANHLLQKRFMAAIASIPVEPKYVESESDCESAQSKPKSPPSIRELVKRIAERDQEAIKTLHERARGNDRVCLQIVAEGVAVPLVRVFDDNACRKNALALLLLLSDAAVAQSDRSVKNDLILGDTIPALLKIMGKDNARNKELCCAILGNLAHESPTNQDAIGKAGATKLLVEIVGQELEAAQEAAYALWNLTVGHQENGAAVFLYEGVSKLIRLLKSHSTIAQENAAGALMQIAMADARAREEIVNLDAIPRLCELLSPNFEKEVNCQAAGALLNVVSDDSGYATLVVRCGAVAPLLELIKNGSDLARVYAAGTIMNLARLPEAAAEIANNSGMSILASALSKATGQGEVLGALANLAGGSPERQIAIYKAQVTRKCISFLQDQSVDIRRSAAALIMNLSPHMRIKERIVEAGALRPLVERLRDPDHYVKERASGALANLFNDHSANVHAGFKQAPDIVPALIDILQAANLQENAQRQSAHALAMLAAEEGSCDAVWAAGGGKTMMAHLKEGMAEAALGIMNLSWRWPEVKQEFTKSNALEHLMKMVRTGDGMAQEYACGALMNLTAASRENANKVSVVAMPLIELLDAEGTQLSQWAAGVLANIFRARPEVQKKAAQAGTAEKLAALLLRATPCGRSLVVLALTALAEGDAGCVRKVLSRPRERARLKDCRENGSDELREYLEALVSQIGDGFKF